MYAAILSHWPVGPILQAERYHPDSDRLVVRLRTQEGAFLLRGLPASTPEATIRSNTAAHRFLGNTHGLAQQLIPLPDGRDYLQLDGYWYYLMEFIQGRLLQETPEDEYALGCLARRLHSLTGSSSPSPLAHDKHRFDSWFGDKPFKAAFDAILAALPEAWPDRCFIHTDLGPHNAVMDTDGHVRLIDLDDAGVGPRALDLGWPFIMQFVDFNHQTGDMRYRYDLALAYLRGYYGSTLPSPGEYDLLWQGAAFMHISYMQTYGPYAVDSLWRILCYGLACKDTLYDALVKGLKGDPHADPCLENG